MALKIGIAFLGLLFTAFPLNLSAGSIPRLRSPQLKSSAFLVKNQRTNELLLARRADTVLPIASITKLMTAIVTLDARLDLDEVLTIEAADKDTLRHSASRLPVGTTLCRRDILLVALMASDNRAAHALGRTYPGGVPALVKAMNRKAKALGLPATHFVEPTGLSEANVSCALDLSRLVDLAYHYPLIRDLSTREEAVIRSGRRRLHFVNTNALVRNSRWNIGLSKTGFIQDSGQCLVMQARMGGEPLLIVLLDSVGKNSRIGDANRIRQWLENLKPGRKTRKRR